MRLEVGSSSSRQQQNEQKTRKDFELAKKTQSFQAAVYGDVVISARAVTWEYPKTSTKAKSGQMQILKS